MAKDFQSRLQMEYEMPRRIFCILKMANFSQTSAADPVRESYKLLLSQRDLLEIEANAIHSELTSTGPNGERDS